VPALNPFDLTVNWNLGASFNANEVWYGWFSIGTTALKKDDVGKLDFNLYKVAAPEPILLDLFLPLITRP
ncbi:MAG: hypothetical protein PHW11_08610, partial [Anaerolineaceae bacterium]|nr:hypothetical protein [Anaerolineaceae bacterium]